ELNAQNQPKITWPANFVVARAYLDQLTRGNALPPQRIAELNATMIKVEASSDRKEIARLKTMAASLAKDAAKAKTPEDGEGMGRLAATIEGSPALRP